MARWLPLHEAADVLGVSVITLKRRIKAEKVNARKEAFEKGERSLIEIADVPADEWSSEPSPDTNERADHERLIDHLTSQVAWLQRQLETRDREVAELHVLLQRAQLPAPVPAVQSARPPQPDISPELARDTSVSAQADTNLRRQPPAWWRRLTRALWE